MISAQLYLLQRLSALIMAPLVLGHIAVMIYAVQNGLSADEILSRTSGHLGWMMFYGLFVLAVGIHAAIGLRAISYEWFGLSERWLDILGWAVFIVLSGLGWNAVWSVTG